MKIKKNISRERKISKEKKRISQIKKQIERLKILEEIQKLEEEENEKSDDNNLAEILKFPELGDSIERFSDYFGLSGYSQGFSGSQKRLF